MPEVMATISDNHRLVYYILKVAGSPAVEIFNFYSRTEYNARDILVLNMLPVITGPTVTGSSDEAGDGVYISGDVKLQDVLCDSGNLTCGRTGKRYIKQATLEPHDDNTMVVTYYLRNGEILMHPASNDQPPSEKLIYPFSPILIGRVDHLNTPLGLAVLKDRLNDMVREKAVELHDRVSTGTQPGTSGSQVPRMTFEPATSSDDSANASSVDSSITIPTTTTASSSILAGTIGSVPTTVGPDTSNSSNLGSVLTSGLDAEFEPWMASTAADPPSSRPGSSQSLPTPDGSPSKEGPPRRPRSTTPIRARRRQKMTDKSYRPDPRFQPITTFFTPSPPKGSPPDTSPTSGQKRRSGRLNPEDQPDPKRPSITPPVGNGSQDTTSLTSQSMDLTNPIPANGNNQSSSIEEITLDDPITLMEPAPNSSVEIIGERRPHGEPMTFIDLVDDSPNSSREDSSRQVISISSSRHSQGVQPPEEDSPAPSEPGHDFLTRANITLHTNLPMAKPPQHVFIKAENNHLSVKFLTFRANNLEDLVHAFFAEPEDFDNPPELQGVADFAFERLLTPDDSQDSAQAANISTSSSEFDTSKVSTVSKDSPNVSRGTITISDPEDSILPVDNSNPQTMSQSLREMELVRDIGFERDSSIQIEDVRTAGETTLDDFAEDAAANPQHHPQGDGVQGNGGVHPAPGNGQGHDDQGARGNGGEGDPGAQGNGGDEEGERGVTRG